MVYTLVYINIAVGLMVSQKFTKIVMTSVLDSFLNGSDNLCRQIAQTPNGVHTKLHEIKDF